MKVTKVEQIQTGKGSVYEVTAGGHKWRTRPGHRVGKVVRFLEGKEVKSFHLENGEIVGLDR
jgi:hypothetical protein